ncbi:HlyD family secretion protein [Methyloceanibacter superfactus]|uniref:HlyD family secretion protein n=1 Tax=Methyloceanibacter superfactus TaxID=1774969 RepID=UPI0009F47C35|nr:HlyD family efflux transporter periplasmic adaptor subunit [Methyloceanibacter superfactus]
MDAYDAAAAAFSKAQDEDLVVTTPTVKLRAASAQLDKATNDRVKTHVTAPGSGWLSNVRLRPGAVIQAGTPAFSIIEDGPWWVDANFKETDLGRIKPGQPATISLDMYSGVTLEASSRASAPGPAPCSPCCRRRTRPATGSRSPSAFQYASRSPARLTPISRCASAPAPM